jgi:aminopeptidase N
MLFFREGPSVLVKREDYTAPAFWVDTVDLAFDLDPAKNPRAQPHAPAPQP